MTQSTIFFKHYPDVDSTMNEAKRLIRESSEYKSGSIICISADSQSQGRGQHGKSWASPRGAGLYLSLVSDLKIPAENSSILATKLCIKSLKEGLKRIKIQNSDHKNAEIEDREQSSEIFQNCEFQLKPLNDIYVNNCKLAGILLEKIFFRDTEYNTVGIGINLYKSGYQLKESSLETAKAMPISLEEIIGINATQNLVKSLLKDLSENFLEYFYLPTQEY
jgi:BirA family transcriptional regulator, biotin operon repressor / biotin---[acetyl-CoA-carboxylase] ligase